MEESVVNQEQQCTEPDCLKEGKAKIILEKKNIFYNPVQEFNRDLSIAILTQYSKELKENSINKVKTNEEKSFNGLRVLEALSATGLRSIRYAKEVPNISEIVANDISIKAVETIKKNVIYNEVEGIVTPNCDDATMVMYLNKKTKFDVVDLDPYGCPTIFLDGAVQCIKDHGLLMVTATDMAVLAGNSPETCYVKYGAISLKSKACHEMALRILLQHISNHAGRYGRVMTPILSVSADFYIRVFVKIHTSQLACKSNISNLGMVYQCVGCESLTIQALGTVINNKQYKLPQAPAIDKLCEFCKHKHHMGGPIWTGPLHDKEFISKILTDIDSEEENNINTLGTKKRIQGILHVIHEELDNPLYYQIDRLTAVVKCQVPPMVHFRSALINAGYKVSYSHANRTSIKTDAPNQVIWDVVRAWEKQNPVKREKFDENSVGLAILNGESRTDVSFQKHPEAVPFSQQKKMRRYQKNPSAYWGPGTKSTVMNPFERVQNSKKEKNQNKKRRKEKEETENVIVEKKKNLSKEENDVNFNK